MSLFRTAPLALIALAFSCGSGEEPTETGSQSVQSEYQENSGSGVGRGDENSGTGVNAVAAEGPAHPHPEWAEIEIATDDLASAIEPTQYVAEIREALSHHGTREDPIPITTDFMGGWTFDEMKEQPFPEHVTAINGKYVVVKGFMLPDIDFEGITEFHLVRSLWGCCFGAPPRVNELIRINTPDAEGLRYTYNTLEIIGRIEVLFETEDGLIEDLYRLSAESILEGDFDDPLAPANFNPATDDDLQGFLPEMEF